MDKVNSLEYFCALYFDQSGPCLGGVLAIDGKSGKTIWTHWTAHAIFSVDCNFDLNNDNINDCVIAGRGGILQAVNSRDGSLLWELPPFQDISIPQRFDEVYDARYIADVDNDTINDIVASHTWQTEGPQSEIVLVSGKNGDKIIGIKLLKKEQLFVSPQLIVHPDGETYFILPTMGEKKSGGLYIISYTALLKGEFVRKLRINTLNILIRININISIFIFRNCRSCIMVLVEEFLCLLF